MKYYSHYESSASKGTKYKQVRMEKEKKLANGTPYAIISTTFIPSKFAQKGKTIKVKVDGTWDDGWIITDVYSAEFDEEYVNERSQDYKRTRKASDI